MDNPLGIGNGFAVIEGEMGIGVSRMLSWIILWTWNELHENRIDFFSEGGIVGVML